LEHGTHNFPCAIFKNMSLTARVLHRQVTDTESGDEDGDGTPPLRWGSKPAPKRRALSTHSGGDHKRVRSVGPGDQGLGFGSRYTVAAPEMH